MYNTKYIYIIYTCTPICMIYLCIYVFSIRIVGSCLYNYPFADSSTSHSINFYVETFHYSSCTKES